MDILAKWVLSRTRWIPVCSIRLLIGTRHHGDELSLAENVEKSQDKYLLYLSMLRVRQAYVYKNHCEGDVKIVYLPTLDTCWADVFYNPLQGALFRYLTRCITRVREQRVTGVCKTKRCPTF